MIREKVARGLNRAGSDTEHRTDAACARGERRSTQSQTCSEKAEALQRAHTRFQSALDLENKDKEVSRNGDEVKQAENKRDKKRRGRTVRDRWQPAGRRPGNKAHTGAGVYTARDPTTL